MRYQDRLDHLSTQLQHQVIGVTVQRVIIVMIQYEFHHR